MTEEKQQFSIDLAKQIGNALGIDWNRYGIEKFRLGIEVELEHGVRDPNRSLTQDELIQTGKIAWAHLNDNPAFYTRFAKMESSGLTHSKTE